MNPAAKLGAFGLALVAMVGGGAALGQVVGPIDTTASEAHGEGHGGGAAGSAELPAGGLLVSQDGVTFAPASRVLDGGPFAFRITGADGHAVTHFDVLHDRRLHLIVASRDLHQYAHLHPTMAPDGTWSVAVPDLPPGAYRAFADVQPTGGEHVTLGIDLTVPGTPPAVAPLVPSRSTVVDGLSVELTPADGDEVAITVRDGEGRVVTTEPYLGAAGHLVALRDGDLAYVHVHPLDDEPRGPVRFAVELPSAGRYALFFDFQVDGVVRTAAFVLDR